MAGLKVALFASVALTVTLECLKIISFATSHMVDADLSAAFTGSMALTLTLLGAHVIGGRKGND